MKKFFSVSADDVNTRVDRWFKRNIYNIPQSLIEKSLRKGKIKINNKKSKSSYKLKKNDEVLLNSINFSIKNNKPIKSKYKATKTDLSLSSNLFIENNNDFVVVNKPAGIAVQSGTKSKRNLLDILRGTKEFINASPYTVHRIDKETTGILIVAKNRKFAQLFTSLFRIRKIHKTYLGVILGELPKIKGTLTDELYHFEGKRKINLICVQHK